MEGTAGGRNRETVTALFCLVFKGHGRNLFKISEWAGVDKIQLAILLKIHRSAEMDPQNGKSSRERETACFCSHFSKTRRLSDPRRLQAERRSKSKQSRGNSS